ncbi:hypothetical protein BASA82_000650 [Batrachochytrium salamandrivorans]|nr:hypothetical protein BASA82_000650 [Batrachochytrium salamandrivorans]
MGRLEYDSGAFAFFFLALWLAVLMPFTYSSVKFYFASQRPVITTPIPKLSSYGDFPVHLVEKKNAEARQAHAANKQSSQKRLGMVALGWSLILAYLLMLSESGMKEIAHFDPFEILGLSPSALTGVSEIQIKKAYKKLSLVYHPDRCQAVDKAGKALCETRFVMVAKAYEALTDPVAKENFERYGNPDGRQALEMSIGLPKWLLESENQTWVIASYLLLVLVVFPASVMLLTWNAAREGEKVQKRVFPDTEEVFRIGIRNGTSIMLLMELFSLAAEFRPFLYRGEEEKKFILELRNELVREDRFPLQVSKLHTMLIKQGLQKTEGNEKIQVLLSVHLHRQHQRLVQFPNLLEDLERMLVQSPVLLKSIVGHARVTCNFQVVCHAIMFMQYVNQAIAPGPAAAIKMLPHVDDEVPAFANKVCPKLKETGLNLPLLAANEFDRPEPIRLFDDPKQDQDFSQALRDLPFRVQGNKEFGTLKDEINTKLQAKRQAKDIGFVFEPESYQGDLVHVVARLKRRIVREHRLQSSASPANKARTPFLPHEVKEEWYFVLVGGPQPKGFNNIPSEREMKIVQFNVEEEDPKLEEIVCDLPFGTAFNTNDWINTADFPIGVTRLSLYCFSNVYPGLESSVELDLTLLDPAKMPKYEHHEEDSGLEKEGLSLYSLLQPQNENDGHDSDFEDGTAKGGDDNEEEEEEDED